MGELYNPNAFAISQGPSVGRAIESGFGMGMQAQNMNMKKQDFANQQSDRQEVRNAMTEYAAASDDAGREVAAGKVGIVSPQMYAQLSQNMRQANAEQRAAMQGMIDERGSMAYMALNEKDPAKRQKIWESYRNSQPEKIRGMIPEDASEEGLTVVMGQSKEMLDFMRDEKKWQRQEASADARASRQEAGEATRFANQMSLEDKRFQNKQALEEIGGKSEVRGATGTAMINALSDRLDNAEPGTPEWNMYNNKLNELLGTTPQQSTAAPSGQATSTRFTYDPASRKLVPAQ